MGLGLFKGRDGDFPRDRWEVVKELLQRMSAQQCAWRGNLT